MIHLVTALQAEAKPLIKHFGMRGESQVAGFRLYRGDDVRLVVTGVGSVNAAAAVALLGTTTDGAGEDGPRPAIWVNPGVAGHRDLAIGQVALAGRILDRSTGRAWYPPTPFETALPRLTLTTAPQPVLDYPDTHLYDMEGAAFFATAVRFSTAELVQCLKVVSDNRDSPPDSLTGAEVSNLVASATGALEGLLDQLRSLRDIARRGQQQVAAHAFLGRWHFTETQRHQLRGLLERHAALLGLTPSVDEVSAANAKELLAVLARRVEKAGIAWQPGRLR